MSVNIRSIFFLDTKRLYNFLLLLLNDPLQRYNCFIVWKDVVNGIFKIVDPSALAKLWGAKKNIPSMNYDKLSRALRYYYKAQKLKKVPHARQCYQFIFNRKQIKNETDEMKIEVEDSILPIP